MNQKHEHWASGDAYEHFMGRWSREVALRFLNWLQVGSKLSYLDVGCGTGALTRVIFETCQPEHITGLDSSVDFVHYARENSDRASFYAADATALACAGGLFDVLVSGLALNFVPGPERALSEMRRVVKSGGLVAAYVWDYAGKMEFLRYFWDAVVELDVRATSLHEGNRFPICQPDELHQLWQQAGLQDVLVEAIDIPTVFDNFEAYWQLFTLGNFPAPNYVSSLDTTQRNRLQDHLRASVPIDADGSIHMIARVWAIRGYR